MLLRSRSVIVAILYFIRLGSWFYCGISATAEHGSAVRRPWTHSLSFSVGRLCPQVYDFLGWGRHSAHPAFINVSASAIQAKPKWIGCIALKNILLDRDFSFHPVKCARGPQIWACFVQGNPCRSK